jgi:hypothetical protein
MIINEPISDLVHEGDIVLSDHQMDAQLADTDSRVKRKAFNGQSSKWPTADVGVIAYTFDAAASFSTLTFIVTAEKKIRGGQGGGGRYGRYILEVGVGYAPPP